MNPTDRHTEYETLTPAERGSLSISEAATLDALRGIRAALGRLITVAESLEAAKAQGPRIAPKAAGGRSEGKVSRERGRDHNAAQLIGIEDVRRALAIGERACWRLVSTGELPTVRIGRRRLVDVRDLERFIEAHREGRAQ